MYDRWAQMATSVWRWVSLARRVVRETTAFNRHTSTHDHSLTLQGPCALCETIEGGKTNALVGLSRLQCCHLAAGCRLAHAVAKRAQLLM
jgi:hypothetical protein